MLNFERGGGYKTYRRRNRTWKRENYQKNVREKKQCKKIAFSYLKEIQSHKSKNIKFASLGMADYFFPQANTSI